MAAAVHSVPDLMALSKLVTEFHSDPDYTQHITSYIDQDQTRVDGEERWTRQKRIGQGAFGNIWLEQCIQGDKKNELRAVKQIRKDDIRDLYRNLEAITLFSHQKFDYFFVKFSGWYENTKDIFIAMEFLPEGDLDRFLRSPLPEPEVQNIAAQLLEGLQVLHDYYFIHRNIKPSNILVVNKGPNWWVKIGGFGITGRVLQDSRGLRTLVGTPAFTAPEILNYMRGDVEPSYTDTVDIWSLGVTLFLMLTGERPFQDLRDGFLYATGSLPFPIEQLLSKSISENGRDFLQKAMQPNPENRPRTDKCRQHLWVQAIKPLRMRPLDIPTRLSELPELLEPTGSEPSAHWSTPEQMSVQSIDESAPEPTEETRSVWEISTTVETRAETALDPDGEGDDNLLPSNVPERTIAQGPREDERSMAEGQHMLDRELSETFGFVDSAYGTASQDRNNRKITVDDESMDRVDSTEHDKTEARSIYSVLSTTDSVMHTYLQDLANELSSAIDTNQPKPERLWHLCENLEQLLQQFAFRIGDELSSQEGQEILYHVYRYRRELVNLFEQNLLITQDDQESPQISSSDHQISTQEKVRDWFNNQERDPVENPIEEATFEISDEPELADDSLPTQPNKYRESILGTSAFQWLITTMRQELILVAQEEKIRDAIRKGITKALPLIPRFSRKQPIKSVTLLFIIEWNPRTFIAEQEYPETPHMALERAITLTGTLTNAQALPCLQYMQQTWPISGERTLRLIQKLLSSRQGVCTQANGGTSHSKLVAWKTSCAIYVEAVGSRSSVVEIGEQLAWLGSALRSSPFTGIALCSPYINVGDQTLNDKEGLKYRTDADRSIIVKIDFTLEEAKDGPSSEGRCWHSLFRNPVVVRGFPVLERGSRFPGLETPLHIMAGLVQAGRACTFDETIILKGFSSMLVPIKQSGNMTLWHHFFHIDGTRIPCLERGLSTLRVSNFSKLQATRHIVGWCARANHCAGKAGARYEVARSRLQRVGPGFLLEKVSLTAGKCLMPGFNFALGVKDTPVHLHPNPYLLKLRDLRYKYFIFWDTKAKKGWLVNGLDGLLHLLRAKLKHYEMDECMRLVLMSKSEEILEPQNELGTYAFDVLRDERNMKLPIFPDKDGTEIEAEDPNLFKRKKKFFRFEDQVEELYSQLELLIDHQLEKAGQSGIDIKGHIRRRLEGWDFQDLVSGNNPMYPLVETIEAVGRGWVDFTRSIQAVTLFGKDFGDMIQPSDEMNCSHWRQLPDRKFYLAACIADLERIMDTKNGDEMEVPRKMCDGISWFSPTPPYEVCQCGKSRNQRHVDPVQVLWPTSLTNRLPLTKRVPLPPGGAVVFGHNARFKWRWGDYGDPVEGDPNLEIPEIGSDHFTASSSSKGSKSGEDPSTEDTSLQPQVTGSGDGEIRPAPGGSASYERNRDRGGHPSGEDQPTSDSKLQPLITEGDDSITPDLGGSTSHKDGRHRGRNPASSAQNKPQRPSFIRRIKDKLSK